MSDFLTFMLPPFAACLILVGIHAYLGIHVLARGVIFVDLSLAQVAALGATLAVVAGFDLHGPQSYFFSLAAALIGATVFTFTRTRRSAVPQEAIIGIVYAVSAAAGILVLDRAPHGAEHIKQLLVGSILWVTWPEVVRTLVIYAIVGFVHWRFRERLLRISFGHESSEGRSLRGWDFLFYATFAVVITSSVEMAGVLLVFSFLIVPAVSGALVARSLRARLLVGWSIGFLVSAVGCSVSYLADLPTGATIVCAFGVAILAVAAVSMLRLPLQGR